MASFISYKVLSSRGQHHICVVTCTSRSEHQHLLSSSLSDRVIDSRELAIACPMVSKIQHCLLEVLHLLQPSCSSSRSTLAASRHLFHLANARASLFHALIHALLTYRAGVSSRAWQTKDSEQVVLYRTTCSELRCRLFIVLGEITGSNLTAGSCVYHDCHCGIQPSVPLLQQCVGDSASPSLSVGPVRGTVKWLSAFG